MSDERELKLQCLNLAGGDVAKAREMFEWLHEEQGDREVRAYVNGRADGYTQAIQSLELEAEKEVAREQLEREPEQDDTPAEHISILTGDPAIEPETGLHGEPIPQPEWNEPEPVTNPEADAAAKAHDWYDPKAVAERNRFNPFALFRAKEDA